MAKKSPPKDSARNEVIQMLSFMLGDSIPHFRQLKFKRCVAHLELMFLRSLRDNFQYVLDGSTLVFVYFDKSAAPVGMFQHGDYVQNVAGKWSACCVPKFQFDAFFEKPDLEQDRLVTDLVEKALTKAAKLAGADPKPIGATANMIREGDYSARFLIPEFAPVDRATGRKARFWSQVSRGYIRWQIELLDQSDNILLQETLPDSLYQSPAFKPESMTTRWEPDGLTLRGSNGRTIHRLQIPE